MLLLGSGTEAENRGEADMLLGDVYGQVPGMSTTRETYESEFRWGMHAQGVFTNGLISGAARDTGNNPTYELRPGLLLGQILSTGLWTTYNPNNTDGSEIAGAILIEGLRVQDFDGNNQNKLYSLLVGGPVKAGKIIGLDLQARQCMDKFMFDDIGNLQGNHWFPWKRFQNKTANYTLVASDNFSLFDNTGAGGEVDLTLPPIANGYYFALKCAVAQTFKFISNEGGNIIGDTATRSSVSVAAIGAGLEIYSEHSGTKWIVQNISTGSQTVSYA